MDTFDFLKLFLSSLENTMKKVKRQNTNWGKLFATSKADKGFEFRS